MTFVGMKHREESNLKRSESIRKMYVEGKKMGFRSEKGKEAHKLSPRDHWKGKKLPFTVWNKGKTGSEYRAHYKNGFGGAKKGERTGELSPGWKGGITPLRGKIQRTDEWGSWIKAVMERDSYSCVLCGVNNNNLHVDHIIPFFYLRDKNNITTVEEARACVELWDINNGRVLCVPCHKLTDTYLSKARKYRPSNLDGLMHNEEQEKLKK